MTTNSLATHGVYAFLKIDKNDEKPIPNLQKTYVDLLKLVEKTPPAAPKKSKYAITNLPPAYSVLPNDTIYSYASIFKRDEDDFAFYTELPTNTTIGSTKNVTKTYVLTNDTNDSDEESTESEEIATTALPFQRQETTNAQSSGRSLFSPFWR